MNDLPLICVDRLSRRTARRTSRWTTCTVLFVVTSCLWATAGAAASEGDSADEPSWTPEFSLQFQRPSQLAVSPDGSMVAYVVREAQIEGEQSSYLSQVHVAAADGSWDRQYTRGAESAGSPAFSPDGQWLAFLRKTSGEDGKTQVWRMRVGGGEARPVTDLESGVSSFQYRPDGKALAVLSSDPETKEEKQAKKEKRDPILVDQDHKYSHLYLVDLEVEDLPGEAIALTGPGAGDGESTEASGEVFHINGFDWTPDGKTLVFAHQRDPLINTGMMDGDLSRVDVATRVRSPLATSGGTEQSPVVSTTGDMVAYTNSGDRAEPVGLADVYVRSLSGEGGVWHTDQTPNRSANLIDWLPGSERMLLLETMGTTRQLLELDRDGNHRVVSLSQGEPMEGVIGSPALSADGSTVAFTFETADRPPEVFVARTAAFDAEDLGAVQISSLYDAVEMPAMGRTDVVTWTSKDGLPVEGLITYPVGYEPGRRVPLVLNVHGGPAGVFSQTFTGASSIYLIQHFAEKGYAVLRPNPRGSTGYGRDFRYANVRDWGFGDYEDLMSGVDWAIEQGIADAEDLYLMGWSYGGYMTSFAITRTDRFRAASMGAGLPNLVSMVHTTDIPDYLAAHQGAELWEDVEEYERHSAMYRLDRVTTPTQVLHGTGDLRVPFDQGRELYLGLQRRGVPTEMIAYPRTPHGPREPKLLMDVTPRILSWFERFAPAGTDDAQEGDGTRESEPR